MRAIGLKLALIAARSEPGFGFLPPKKRDGLGARETDRVRAAADCGLDGVLDVPAGVKLLAPGFGLNSSAFTLNLLETAEVGVVIA